MYLLASSLAAALLDGHFDHPASCSDLIHDLVQSCVFRDTKWFFNSLLDRRIQ
jgi:hypothetical protein